MTASKNQPRYEFTVPSTQAQVRLDSFLATQKKLALSRSRLQKLIQGGAVTVNRKVAQAKTLLQTHDLVVIEIPLSEPPLFQPVDMALTILHEDDVLLVLNKPAHLSVHPGAGEKEVTLVQALLHQCQDLSNIGGPTRPGIVHRLDKDTSGVMVVAKNNRAHAQLAEQFAQRQIEKEYEAIVWGKMGQPQGVIDTPIARHPVARQKMTSKLDRFTQTTKQREASSAWRCLHNYQHFAHLRLQPKTGRTHQLRVHLADLGHPIVGDKVYGGIKGSQQKLLPPALQLTLTSLSRQALHASSLSFTHPQSGKRLQFHAPLPSELVQLLRALKLYDDS